MGRGAGPDPRRLESVSIRPGRVLSAEAGFRTWRGAVGTLGSRPQSPSGSSGRSVPSGSCSQLCHC